jgi:hypothetical protein
MSLPGIGEDFSLLDTILAELPELFYAEIFPKLDFRATLKLAQVNKSCRDAVWSVDGVRSMKKEFRDYFRRVGSWQFESIYSLMHYAVKYGNVPAVRALLKSGEDANNCFWAVTSGLINYIKVTPLYYAALHGHLSIVALLLDAGANAREPDHRVQSPIDAARRRGHKTIVKLLKAAGA